MFKLNRGNFNYGQTALFCYPAQKEKNCLAILYSTYYLPMCLYVEFWPVTSISGVHIARRTPELLLYSTDLLAYIKRDCMISPPKNSLAVKKPG